MNKDSKKDSGRKPEKKLQQKPRKRGTPLTPAGAIRARRIRLADREAAFGLLRKTVIFALAVFVIFGLLFGITPMKGNDMLPKFAPGDILLFYRLQRTYSRNDVVVMNRDGTQYVGRILGLPYDTIEITDGNEIIINGNRIVESEIFYETERFEEATQYPLELGEKEYFILGDHRESAKDSRYFGTVREDEFRGKVITVIKRADL